MVGFVAAQPNLERLPFNDLVTGAQIENTIECPNCRQTIRYEESLHIPEENLYLFLFVNRQQHQNGQFDVNLPIDQFNPEETRINGKFFLNV